jgi:hypothetical protein
MQSRIFAQNIYIWNLTYPFLLLTQLTHSLTHSHNLLTQLIHSLNMCNSMYNQYQIDILLYTMYLDLHIKIGRPLYILMTNCTLLIFIIVCVRVRVRVWKVTSTYTHVLCLQDNFVLTY